jgi:SAM-dependent methyltransferase
MAARRDDGDLVRSMTAFLEAYEQVRRAEGWGDDDLDLPFRPKRHKDIWEIRQRTFRVFESLAMNIERGPALDVGAGNCWMTRYLDQWGFDAIAIDINDSSIDGLRAGQKFIEEGADFRRVRTGMDRLPFASGQFKLLALNASFHYAHDFSAALSEFERVLAPGGMIAIIDSPFYDRNEDGERMLAERVVDFREKYGIAEALARSSRYLTFNQLHALAESSGFKYRVHEVWPGFRRKYQELRARLVGRRIAQFPVVVLERAALHKKSAQTTPSLATIEASPYRARAARLASPPHGGGEFAGKMSNSILPLAEGESRSAKRRRQGVSSATFCAKPERA